MLQPTARPGSGSAFVDLLAAQRVLAVVRAAGIPDEAALCGALRDGGINLIELTFTTPDLARHLTAAAEYAASPEGAGIVVGVGTVLDAEQARVAVGAGARFLVTPGVGAFAEGIVAVARDAGLPVMLGALTPSEVLLATGLGADAVKVFPASLGGPRLLKDLHGPFPDVALVPSGGVTADNARAFLDAGAVAVSAGTGAVPPAAVESGDWATLTASAKDFCSPLRDPLGPQ